MSFELTARVKRILGQRHIKPNLILEVDGIPIKFGALGIDKKALFDDGLFFDDDVHFDSPVADPDGRDWITLGRTTKTLDQQLIPEKAGAGSISSITIEILNKNSELSKLFQVGNLLDDPLNSRARVYLTFDGAEHPEDSVNIFNGSIEEFSFTTTTCILVIAHPESKLRQEIFQQITTPTTSEVKYKQLLVQNIQFKQRLAEPSVVSVEYVNGAALGAAYTINTSVLTITVTPTTTADEIEDIVRDTPTVNSAVEAEVVGNGSIIQVAYPLTQFETDTTINVDSTTGFIPSGDNVTAYLKVDQELMEITSSTDTSVTVIRDQLNSFVNRYDDEIEAETFYRIQELSPIIMALKLYLSSAGNPYYRENTIITRINQGTDAFIQNAIFFTDVFDIQEDTGLVAGDTVVISGSVNPSNDGGRTIESFGEAIDGSYIVLDGPLMITDVEPTSICKFRSQFNVYPEGIGLDPSEVDVTGHLEEEKLHNQNFNPIDIYIKETFEGKEILEKYIFRSQALYGLPRKGKIGIKFVSPPIADQNVIELGPDNILNMKDLKIKRSLNENFFNVVGFEYEEDSIEDDLLVRDVFYSADSTARLKRSKVLKIDARGFRKNAATTQSLKLLSSRILSRYKFASQYVEGVQVLYSQAFQAEIGDVCLFGKDTKLGDADTEDRTFKPRLMEIVNKKLNFINGKISLDLLETSFSSAARYGLFSVSSLLSSDSTATELVMKTSFNDFDFSIEKEKWTRFLGEKIRIRSDDYEFDEVVTLQAFSEQNQQKIIIDPPLTFSVLDNYIMEIPEYDETDALNESKYKIFYTYMIPQSVVSVAIDSENFETLTPDEYTIGELIQIHSDDYDRDSSEVEILDIIGNVITTKDIGFVPQIGDKIELADFKDGGYPYKLI